MGRSCRAPFGLLLVFFACGQNRTEVPEFEIDSIQAPGVSAPEPVLDTVYQKIEVPDPPQSQIDQYTAEGPKSVIELQQFRQSTSMEIRDQAGDTGTATLVNLNPHINAWFLLRLQWRAEAGEFVYHLENADPVNQRIRLDPAFPNGLVLEMPGKRWPCQLWNDSPGSPIVEARRLRRPYVSLCEGRLFLRNQTEGHKTTLEWATDFLRDHVSGGEQITVFVRRNLYRDAFLNVAEVEPRSEKSNSRTARPPGAPAAAVLHPRYENSSVLPVHLGIELEQPPGEKVPVGRWYEAKNLPGVFVSTVNPGVVAEEVIEAQKGLVNPLDEVDSRALVYLIAFDLSQFELGFSLGTEHPRVDWSERALAEVQVPSLPGPDGIGTMIPLVRTGMTRPDHAPRIVATFTGGFKRYHGAFRRGDFALRNRGTHYGFVENGVLMSKLHPGLATLLVFEDGRIDLKTWTQEDSADLKRVRHARQNGVAIVEYDEATRTSRPGPFVSRPALGNWSGSVEGRYRTLRSGVALQERGEDRFLIYGYFSSATPSAMARVFQAYGCRSAMLLDMNALEHTYLALYLRENSRLKVQHLIQGMEVLDKSSSEQIVPRFIGYADNRDFFYVFRKETEP